MLNIYSDKLLSFWCGCPELTECTRQKGSMTQGSIIQAVFRGFRESIDRTLGRRACWTPEQPINLWLINAIFFNILSDELLCFSADCLKMKKKKNCYGLSGCLGLLVSRALWTHHEAGEWDKINAFDQHRSTNKSKDWLKKQLLGTFLMLLLLLITK